VLEKPGARTVLTTGANSGIGLAIVLELARVGFHSVGGVRSAEKAQVVHEKARSARLAVETVLLDVTDEAQSAEVVSRLRPYGLVNNAALTAIGAVEDVDDEESRLVLETLLIGPMRLARLALPHMKAGGGGRIVNISSIYGLVTTPLAGWYQASKHALEALSDALRVEVGSAGISVVVVQPGAIRTEIWQRAVADAARRSGSSYRTAYERLRSGILRSERLLQDPAVVGRVVARAMLADRPRARYLVGYDAHLLSLAGRLLPTRVKDRIVRQLVRL
jgi:NAD(P)-dependent dehydrogenase (short-subunit alcohol dehydrogenase family)